MYLANNKITPPKDYEHDSNLTNYSGYTVLYYQLTKGNDTKGDEWFCKNIKLDTEYKYKRNGKFVTITNKELLDKKLSNKKDTSI